MRPLKPFDALASLVALALGIVAAQAQTATNLTALEGLAPVSILDTTDIGLAALEANRSITGAIQTGAEQAPTLRPFPEQQQQALRDAFITFGNADALADGLGSTLDEIYRAQTSYKSTDDGQNATFTNVSPALARVIVFAIATTESDAGVAKYFFANATIDGKKPASPAAMAILKRVGGKPDIFGRTYGFPAGTEGANHLGNPRPFQIEPRFATITGKDFWGVDSGNIAYLRGPTQDLFDSPSYPSGHTTYGYTEALLLAMLIPERYPQMVARAAEYGNDRIILGAHYAMDVVAGRTLALYDLAQLLANCAGCVGVNRAGIEIDDFPQAMAAARADLVKVFEAACGGTIAQCAAKDNGRFAEPLKNLRFYEATQTYNLPVVYSKNANVTEDVGKLAPEAGHLLTIAFPSLTLAEADDILTATEGPGGGFLDNGSAFGLYSRLDLYAAAEKALMRGSTP
jgi:membrane-associated phospholipid phosphatase